MESSGLTTTSWISEQATQLINTTRIEELQSLLKSMFLNMVKLELASHHQKLSIFKMEV